MMLRPNYDCRKLDMLTMEDQPSQRDQAPTPPPARRRPINLRRSSVAGPVVRAQGFGLYYGSKAGVLDITMDIAARCVTAIIGPSGCGKSTFLRSINRMNDLIPDTRAEGLLEVAGVNVYDRRANLVNLRQQVEMVFQRPLVRLRRRPRRAAHPPGDAGPPRLQVGPEGLFLPRPAHDRPADAVSVGNYLPDAARGLANRQAPAGSHSHRSCPRAVLAHRMAHTR